jgi:hypothetical protein
LVTLVGASVLKVCPCLVTLVGASVLKVCPCLFTAHTLTQSVPVH